MLDVAEAFRFAPFEAATFTLGLLVLVLVGGRIAHGFWNTGWLGRSGGVLAGLGLATYLPQFFGTPGLRVAHGVVLGLGLLLMTVVTARRADGPERVARTGQAVAA